MEGATVATCMALFATLAVSILVAVAAVSYKVGKLSGRLKKSDQEVVISAVTSAVSKEGEEKKTAMAEDWQWPIYDEWWCGQTYEMKRKLRAPAEIASDSEAPFEVTYEQRKGWPSEVFVTVLSPHLIQVVAKCLPKNKQVFIEQPKIEAQQLFLALQLIRDYQFDDKQADVATAKCHLKHLVRFLEREYKDTIVHVERMQRERTTSWELLWAFLGEGESVFYTCSQSGQRLQGIVTSVDYEETTEGKHFLVSIEVRDYNGRQYVKGSLYRAIKEFKGEKPMESLAVCPMRFAAQRERLEAMFLANGKKFYALASQRNSFVQFQGARFRKELVGNCWQLKKQKADGRVMVDLLSFARMNPGYPLNNAEPPTSCEVDLMCGMCEGDAPSDEELMLAPAVVYGFSFAIKQWGCFDVNGFSAIKFDDQAFDRDLVLVDPAQKEMLLGLVSQYVKEPSEDQIERIDPISNKGEGCIFLCYGPPGTGKTLTAESVAEKLHRPLWSVSVFELGTNANDVETALLDILDIASQWRAVLLLDEADIYLEKRTSNGDPQRSAMTAIFLRLLEYYRGVLFLTTNRVTSFDDAFCSRISLFLRYYRLSGAQREKVWRNFLGRAGLVDVDLAPLADKKLNGREIRNAIRIAQTWAKSCDVELTTDHVAKVVHMLDSFRDELAGAIADDDDAGSGDRRISTVLAKVRSMKGAPADHGAESNGFASEVQALAP